MAVPMGPGNTEKQLQIMIDLKSTVLCATSSYALLLSEEVQRRGIKDKIHLRKGVIGSERWGDLMRKRIRNGLDIELFDIYGLTEIYGPGIAIDCEHHKGMHFLTISSTLRLSTVIREKSCPMANLGNLWLPLSGRRGLRWFATAPTI